MRALCFGLCCVVLPACMGGSDAELPTAEVVREDFRAELVIPGELAAVRSVSISAPDLRGQAKITSIVEEGTRVEEGDVIVEFERAELESKLEEAQRALEVARTKIDQKRAQLEVRLADLANEVTRAELDLQRARMRVTDSETVPRVERESARLDVEEFTLSVERSKAALESARLEGQAELQLLQLEEQQNQQTVQDVQERLDKTTLRAPADGLVILPSIWKGGSRGSVTAGDTLWRGSEFMQLPDLSEMEVLAWVHEVDASLVAVDQSARIVVDAFPDPPHPATVRRVADLAVSRDGEEEAAKYLKVKLELEQTDETMKPGMTVRAEILVHEQSDVLSLPLEAVVQEGEATFAYVRGLTGFSRREIELGRSNTTHAVVEQGLEEGEVVSLVNPDTFVPGEDPPAARAQGDGSS